MTQTLRIDRAKIQNLDKNKNYIFILVSYFGLVEVDDDIQWIKKVFPSSLVIHDLVQDLWSFIHKDNNADYSFSSLRKSLATPDGGLIKTQSRDLLPIEKRHSPSLKRILAASLKHSGLVKDEIYLRYFHEAERNLLQKQAFALFSQKYSFSYQS